jgi:Kdo2-lipid IVA lauroyltransferase/acyltransferase
MDTALYLFAKTLVSLIQALPLRVVAGIGRAAGAIAFLLDARHRRVAIQNLQMCFGDEKSPAEIHAIARENFRRLGENYCSSVKTAVMKPDEMKGYFEFIGAEKITPYRPGQGAQSCIVAIGHFGNFELYVRFGQFVPGYKPAATYRALKQPGINRVMQSLREQSGCHFYERRQDGKRLRADISETGLLLGLLADQHEGRGLRIPFLGHDCMTSVAPAVFALRYHAPLHTAICYRIGLAKWKIEVGDEIPTRENGEPRPTEAIMRDVNRAYEAAVRRDPANWFWVHRRWKILQMADRRPEIGEPT